MLVVGLTGGISSGKTQVSQFFASKSVPVIDADQIVHDLQAPNSELVHEIGRRFGDRMLTEHNELNRQALGELIFTDEQAKEQLNALIHPRVRQAFELKINEYRQQNKPLIILDVPLLFESKFENLADLIIVVFVEEAIQIERLMKRDQISSDYAKSKISSQLSLREKCEKADIIVDNNQTIEDLHLVLEDVYQQLLARV